MSYDAGEARPVEPWQPAEASVCIVFGCERVADEYLTFSVAELQLVYSVCSDHSCDRRRGSWFAAPEYANRGFVGLRVG